MNRGERDRVLIAFGAVTCVYWLTRAVLPFPIPPLVAMPDLGGVLSGIDPWIRDQSPALSRPDAEIVDSLRREVILGLAQAWIFIGLGVTAGLLITRRRRAGAWMAVTFAGLLLVSFAQGQWMLVDSVGADFWRYWPILLNRNPPLLIRVVLDVSFSIFTLIFLLRPSARRRFLAAPVGAAREGQS